MYDDRAFLYGVISMDWSDLRIFLAIAREGTLGAAARKIGQTQPTMGRRLRALEPRWDKRCSSAPPMVLC